MLQNAFTLESLLETHDLPFVIINADLRIVAVNRAWELSFGVDRQQQVGRPCCADSGRCRHRQLFQSLEGYAGVHGGVGTVPPELSFNVRGFPLLDADGTLYLGETLAPISKPTGAYSGPTMIGQSAAFTRFKSTLLQAAVSQAPVMLLGETGTGKELAAEFVHRQSPRADADFVIVDCTILGEDLFESELFGHEKGAFTGAAVAKKGLFELANGGTLFLDEIGDLPLSQQPKLLRALESGQFRRVGGTTMLKSDVRIVCATHRNLADMVKAGRFREDLFYRLSVFPVDVPRLRDRKQDLPVLIDFFLEQLGGRDGRTYRLNQPALIKLLQYGWPGNIRELRNCLQLAAGLSQNGVVSEACVHFMQPLNQAAVVEATVAATPERKPCLNSLAELEADFINSLIVKYQGNRKLIAAEMNISERTLYRKLNRLNLN
ncbi:sigma 54-interacting transcriptional regulator [Methylomonas sp. UP202]|uniref:sigma-54 interaction domain-containing protein n=1 Tax=unclassified Methylomonas TaxID=2608980 RepID=UPI001438B738|nr:sigma 54-interacting transcriptional regulator [Methylomonas sp. UP202]NJA07032.1 sigma 54-interacting transcriptional regulator [Methylococcaceae bacterium WWC4]WGS87181.1 sigma 54-interacting transcriptional regulator [Methylomonas sp. UP202]